MPLIDILVVCKTPEQVRAVSAQVLADSLGQIFQSALGHTWVRTQTMAASAYAENGVRLENSDLPAFVTVTHSHLPDSGALAVEVQVVTDAVAKCIGRANERVHVQYAPSGAGRQAFGGKLIE